MPIFMDRHDLPGLTAEAVAEGHRQDLRVQHRYNCRALTYWFDERRGTAFCLIEAPDRKAVAQMHREAHGLIPGRIIEVETGLVESFLGRIKDPERTAFGPASVADPAFRVIMAIDWTEPVMIQIEQSGSEPRGIIDWYRNRVRELIQKHDGHETEIRGQEILASFKSVPASVLCALDIHNLSIDVYSKSVGLRFTISMGLGAGDPVAEGDDFFGQAILTARRFCRIANTDRPIVISSVISEYSEKVLGNNQPGEDSIRILRPQEETFTEQLMKTIETIWNHEGLVVLMLSRSIGMSKTHLNRKLKELTGQSPAAFLRDYRLRRALNLIAVKTDNISQIAYGTGFSNPSYFAQCFKEKYGILPSHLLKQLD